MVRWRWVMVMVRVMLIVWVIVENTGTQVHSSTTALAERHTTDVDQQYQTVAPAPASSSTNCHNEDSNLSTLCIHTDNILTFIEPPAVKIPESQTIFSQSAAEIRRLADVSTNQRCDVSLLFKSVEAILYLPDDVLQENEGRVSHVVEDIRTVMSSLATESGLGTDTKPTDVLYMNSILINSEDKDPIAVTSLERHFYVKPRLSTRSEYRDCMTNVNCKWDTEFSFTLADVKAYKKYAYMIYPTNHYVRPLPYNMANKVRYYNRVLDLVLTPISGYNIVVDREISISFDPAPFSSYRNRKKSCYYWSNNISDWASDKCFVEHGKCNCALTGEIREGGQFLSVQYINYKTALTNLYRKYLSNGHEIKEVLFSTKLAFLKSFPFFSSDERYVFLVRLSSILVDFKHNVYNRSTSFVRDVIYDAVESVYISSWISVGDNENKQGYQFQSSGGLSSITVSLDENQTHPLTAVAFNGYRPFQFRVNRSMEVQSTDNYYRRHDDFGVQLTDSVTQYSTSYSLLFYRLDEPFWPEPERSDVKIFNSRVVHIVLAPRDDITENEDIFINLYFKPSPRDYNVSVGCAFWNEIQSKWNDDGCQFQNILPNVCRCNFSAYLQESEYGGQFVVYQYSKEVSLDIKTIKWDTEADLRSSTLALFRYLIETPTTRVTLELVANLLSCLRFFTSKYEFHIKILRAMLLIVEGIPFVPETALYYGEEDNGNLVLIHSTGPIGGDYPLRTVIYRTPQRLVRTGLANTKDMTNDISMDVAFILDISNSVQKSNLRTTRTIYLTDNFLLPKVTYGNFTTFRERHVDIMMEPDETANATDQLIDMYFRPSLYRYEDIKIGCAYWSLQYETWIHDGCWSLAQDSCRCNMTSHFNESRTRALYAVFEYKFVNGSLEERIKHLYESDDFIHNTSFSLEAISLIFEHFGELPVTSQNWYYLLTIMTNVWNSFHKYGLDNENTAYYDILKTHSKIMSRMGDEVFTLIGYQEATLRLNNEYVVAEQKALFDKHSLYQNTEVSRLLRDSEYTFISIVNTNAKPNHQRGVRLFHPAKSELAMPTFETNDNDFLFRDSEFLVMVIMSDEKQNFIVTFFIYAANKSLLPKFVKGYIVHFSRVLDIYFTPLEVAKEDVEDDEEKFVDIFFQPLKSHNTYLKVGCAHWSDNLTEWSTEGCWSVVNGSFETCRCNLTEHLQESRSVARYMIFLFADKQNFQLKQEFNAKEIVFLVGSVLSLSGFLLIIMTASLFSNWREEIGNKILIHLTASSLIYLLLTIYQETHYIYSVVSDRSNAAFIAFTAVVHYSRLSHYCWMLVMSVLQLKKYLTMVGASDIPHLLLKVSLLAWGLPLIPLIILLSWNQTERFSTPNIVTQLALNFIPGALITFLNIVVLCVIVARICACCGWGEKEDLQRHGVSNRELAMRRLKATVLLFFLFGIPTAFEMFNDLGYHVEVLEYLYKMTDPMQGFVMFLFFVVFDGKTWGFWRKWMVDMRRTRPSGGNNLPLNVIKKSANTAATHDKAND